MFAGYHAGGRASYIRVKEDRRLVNHYDFSLPDREYGDGFVRISAYLPFQTRIWLNAHGYLATQLRRRQIAVQTLDNCVVDGADPSALAQAARQFDTRLIEQIARRWLAMVPDPLTWRNARRAIRPTCRSTRPSSATTSSSTGRRSLIGSTRSCCGTSCISAGPTCHGRVRPADSEDDPLGLRDPGAAAGGTVSRLKVFYKSTWGTWRRSRITPSPASRKRKRWPWLPPLGRSTFERLVTPSEQGRQRVAGLRFGAPRAMRLLAALGCAGLTLKAVSQTDLRAVLVDRLGADPPEFTPARLACDLT